MLGRNLRWYDMPASACTCRQLLTHSSQKSAFRLPPPWSVELLAIRNRSRVSPRSRPIRKDKPRPTNALPAPGCCDAGQACHFDAAPEDASHEHVQRKISAHQHSHDKDNNHQWDACSGHLRDAFERYTRFLEQALCICKKVHAEHFLSGHCDGRPAEQPHRYSHSPSSATSSSSAFKRMPHGKIVYRHATREESDCYGKPATEPVAQTTADTCCKGEQECSGEKRPAHSGRGGPDYSSSRRQGVFSRSLKKAAPADIEKQPGNFESVKFTIDGMDCSSCGNIVARAFDGVPGVRNTCVTFIAGTASCDIDLDVTTISEVVRLVERATNYKLARSDFTHPSLNLIMDSQTAQEISHNMPKGIIGYKAVSKREYQVTYDSSVIGARKVLEMIPRASLAPPSQNESLTAGRARLRNVFWTTIAAFCLTVPVVVLSWANPPVSEHTILYVSIVLATMVQIIAVPEFYRPALSALYYNRVVEMDMLVVISISAAYGYSIVAFGLILAGKGADSTKPLFETSTLLISLILLGRLVAAYARKRAIAAVSLRSLQSTTAVLVAESGTSLELDARLLHFGDILLVRPHTQIVTDGTVSSGSSDVDESMITGEAVPIPKFPGDAVIAGTLNTGGTLTIKVNRLPGKNTVTDIANLVEQAQSTKPRVQDLADKVAGYFIPVVVSISIVVTVIWVVIELKVRNRSVGPAVGNAITYGIAVLAVSCPCALGLAVPMVLVIASGVAARLGIIIKTADVVERGFKCTDVIFDKTGTLTENTLDIVAERIFERSAIPSAQIYALVRAMVKDNGHPVSKAIELALEKRGVSPIELATIESIPGAGVQCKWNGTAIRGGSPHWLEIDHVEVSTFADQGLAIYCVADGAGLLAVFGLRTSLRKEAKGVIQELQARQINVHVVSGDGPKAVETVASELGIPASQAASRQSPEGKQNYIRRLKDAGKIVLFCGDGTNDAVAVTEATIGVQIESSSDVTRATADVVLLGNLKGVLQLVDISKAAFHRIMFNFLWAALYNVFAILLAGGAFVLVRIPPAYAGLGELISVVPVVLTAATLLNKRFLVADEH